MTRKIKLLLFVLSTIIFVQCNTEPLATNPSVTALSDYQSNDGTINLNISGGKAPYNVQWSNYENDTTLSGLAAGVYYVTITDVKANRLTDTITVQQPAWPLCVDANGNSYKTAILGDQTWMIENLRSQLTPTGDTIESFTYGNDNGNALNYGRLYTWDAAMQHAETESAQGACPEGWHLPSDREWAILIDNISNVDQNIPEIKNALDLTFGGFYNGQFHNLDMSVSYWTSTPARDNVWKRYFNKNLSKAFRYHEKKTNAISVRCIKN